MSRPGVPRYTATCAYCGERNSCNLDPDEHLPVCAVCIGTQGAGGYSGALSDRIVAILELCPGQSMPDLCEMLGGDGDTDCDTMRRTIKQTLSRLVAKGTLRTDGPRGAFTYYAVEQPEHDDDARAETQRAETIEPQQYAAAG